MCTYSGICNPYCGKCKPPKQRPMECPICGKLNNIELDLCKKCGAPVPKIDYSTGICSYTGLKCVKPCGRYAIVPKEGLALCKFNIPPEEASTKQERLD